MRRERVRRCGPARRQPLLLDMHLDLVGAEREPVAAAQLAALAAADRVGLAVQKRAVGREIGDLPAAREEGEDAMALRQRALGIGQDPVVFRSTADRELATGHRARLRRNIVGAAQHRKRKRHPKPWRKPTLIKRDQPEAYRTARESRTGKTEARPTSAKMAETAGAGIAEFRHHARGHHANNPRKPAAAGDRSGPMTNRV